MGINVGEKQYDSALVGDGYKPSHTNVVEGKATLVKNQPNTGGGGGSNRHCTAHEQVAPALNNIADALEKMASVVLVDISSEIAAIRSLAVSCKMPLNRGE